MSCKDDNLFKKKEAKIIFSLFFIVVAIISIMTLFEKYSPNLFGNTKPVNDGGVCGLVYFRDKRIDKMKSSISLDENSNYSDADISSAIDCIKEYFKQQKNDVGLCSIAFDEGSISELLKDKRNFSKYEQGNVIAILCSYNIYEGSDYADKIGYHENQAIFLGRETATDNWLLLNEPI